MNHEELRLYCLSLPDVTEDFPFDASVLVFRVGQKIFALTNVDARPVSVNLKCEPERALELRATYACVQPGWHMNKKHWNTVTFDGSVSRDTLVDWINHSWDRVVATLPAAQRAKLKR